MPIERVTVSLPAELRQAAQKAADSTGTAFSAIVADALLVWVRGQKIDELIAAYEAEEGEITDDEMQAMAEQMGLPFTSPRKSKAA